MKEKIKAFWGKVNKVFSEILCIYIVVASISAPFLIGGTKIIIDESFKQIEQRDSLIMRIMIKQYDRMLVDDNRYQSLQFKVDSLEQRITELDEDLTDIFD